MEKLERNEAIILDEEHEYYVVEVVELEGHVYVYLVNEKEEVMLAEQLEEDGEMIIETVEDQELVTKIMQTVMERLNQN